MREKNDDVAGGPLRYATEYHAPVLSKTVTEGLVTDPAGTYVDGTLGGGGHAAALLDQLEPDGRVIGIDQDTEAIETAKARLGSDNRFHPIRGNFGDMRRLLADQGIEQVHGILLDLGISSHQIDTARRGFSYMAEGELDMRMDPAGGMSAHLIVNQWSEDELRRLFRELGEEPRAPRIARAILEARPLETTRELADVVRSAVRQRDEMKSLSRIFQAIRIAVNEELEMLERALESALTLLVPGGRMAVISYHSLEDRRVKRFFRYGNLKGEQIRDFYGNLITPWKDLTRKPIQPARAELEVNPRARSARLRIAERLRSVEVHGEESEMPPHK